MIKVSSKFTRLDQKLVYDTCVEQTEIDEIQCDK